MPRKELERWVSLWHPHSSPSFPPSGPSSGLPPISAQGLVSTLGWAHLSTLPSRAPRTPWPGQAPALFSFLPTVPASDRISCVVFPCLKLHGGDERDISSYPAR